MHSRSPDIRTDNAGDGTPIDVERLFHSARIISGSFDTLDDGLRGRVEKLVSWVNGQVVMADERKEEVELQLRKLLATRLRLAADRKRIPAIADERIERPIFVIGFARTGTTLIHSLLAEDPNARAPLWWQTHDPPRPRRGAGGAGADRIYRQGARPAGRTNAGPADHASLLGQARPLPDRG
ncbi:sulfotransferase [Rhizorhabdus histidinilytica]